MKRIMLLTLAVALSMLSHAALAQDNGKVALKLSLKEGRSYTLRVTMDQMISQTIQGQKVDVVQTIGMGYTFHVLSVDAAGTAKVKTTYNSILFKQDSPMGKLEYDSTKPPAELPPGAIGFAALAGQSFTMQIEPDGQVKDLQGVDAMINKMIDALKMPEGEMRDAMTKSFKEQFGDQALKESMEQSLAIYPPKPVGIGDSWSKKIVLSKGSPLIIDNTWTVKDRKGGVAVLDIKSKVSPNPDSAPTQMGPMRVRHSLSGEQTGTMELDEASGWPIRGRMTQDFSGQIKMLSPEDDTEIASWPLSMKSTVTIERF